MLGASFDHEGSFTPDRLIVEAGIARVITVKSGAGLLKRGTVIGKIAADRKYIVAKKTASDGSQSVDMILAEDIDATSADVQTTGYLTGKYNANALTIDASFTLAEVSDGFRTKSLFLETSLT